MSSSRVGLTGSTGFVGSHILDTLLSRGYRVKCLLRSPERSGLSSREGVEVYRGDITDRSSIDEGFFEGIDHLIHLVGIIKETGEQTFERVHFEGTSNVVKLALKHGGVVRFVQMSALGTGPEAAGKYHSTKWKAEEYVRASGLNFTIFRPSLIYGPGGEFIDVFRDMIRRFPIIPVPVSGLLQPIHVRDVASCFVDALENKAAIASSGRTIPIGGPDRLTLKEMVVTMSRVMGKARLVLPIPFFLMMIPASIFEAVLKNPPVTVEQIAMLRADNTSELEEAREVFREFAPISFELGLKEFLR